MQWLIASMLYGINSSRRAHRQGGGLQGAVLNLFEYCMLKVFLYLQAVYPHILIFVHEEVSLPCLWFSPLFCRLPRQRSLQYWWSFQLTSSQKCTYRLLGASLNAKWLTGAYLMRTCDHLLTPVHSTVFASHLPMPPLPHLGRSLTLTSCKRTKYLFALLPFYLEDYTTRWICIQLLWACVGYAMPYQLGYSPGGYATAILT